MTTDAMPQPSLVAAGTRLWWPGAGLASRRTQRPVTRQRVLMLAGVAAAHLGLLIVLAHALRLPVLPAPLAILTVKLIGAETPVAPAPALRLPAPRLAVPTPVLPPPPVILAEVAVPPHPLEPVITLPPTPPTPAPAAVLPKVSPAPLEAPPPAPAPAAPAPDRQVSINQVEYLAPPVLAYPLAARRLREQGQVLVRVRVDAQGRPEQALLQQSSGSPRLDEAALAAVAATRFKPYREGGVARAFWVVMPLVFALDT